MKIEPKRADGFLKAPPAAIRAVLVYGADEGMVRERAELLARGVCPDLRDPFRVADLAAQTLADDPARLADEAAALSMMGGRRVVRVRGFAGLASATATKVWGLIASFAAAPVGDALVVIEGGELKSSAASVKAFVNSPSAAALACYADEGADLERVIRATLAAEGARATDEAIALLARQLGGDRAVARGEIAKLALYVGAGGTVDLDAARACVGDSAELEVDDAIRAVALGERATLGRALDRLAESGTSPIATLRAAQRHFTRLHVAGVDVAAGADPGEALMRLRPPVFWKEQDPMKRQLARWPAKRALAALGILLEAEIAAKSGGGVPAELVVERALFRLAGAGTQR